MRLQSFSIYFILTWQHQQEEEQQQQETNDATTSHNNDVQIPLPRMIISTHSGKYI